MLHSTRCASRFSSAKIPLAGRLRAVACFCSSTAPNTPPSAPEGVRRTPPARPASPPIMRGENGQPLEVVQIEKAGEEAWGGIAQLDKGARDDPTNWGKVRLLIAGDIGTLLAFAAIGRASHGWDVASVETLQTALPFMVGWAAAAPFLGGYGKAAQGGDVKAAALTAAKCWAVGAPIGLILRSVGKGYIPATSFIMISMATTATFMIGWRAAAAALTPKAEPAAPGSKRKDRKGDLFEMVELIMGLTKRW